MPAREKRGVVEQPLVIQVSAGDQRVLSEYGFENGYHSQPRRIFPNGAPFSLLKVVSPVGGSVHGGAGEWSLPQGDQPGDWWDLGPDPLTPCVRGLHFTDVGHAANWYSRWGGHRLFVAETEGVVADADDKYVARKARLVREIPLDKGNRLMELSHQIGYSYTPHDIVKDVPELDALRYQPKRLSRIGRRPLFRAFKQALEDRDDAALNSALFAIKQETRALYYEAKAADTRRQYDKRRAINSRRYQINEALGRSFLGLTRDHTLLATMSLGLRRTPGLTSKNRPAFDREVKRIKGLLRTAHLARLAGPRKEYADLLIELNLTEEVE